MNTESYLGTTIYLPIPTLKMKLALPMLNQIYRLIKIERAFDTSNQLL